MVSHLSLLSACASVVFVCGTFLTNVSACASVVFDCCTFLTNIKIILVRSKEKKNLNEFQFKIIYNGQDLYFMTKKKKIGFITNYNYNAKVLNT